MQTGNTRRGVLGGASATAAALSVGGPARAKAARPPNIVFILADDMGYADIGAFGRTDAKTPNIDSIGADGVKLMQAYANSAVCSPTRTALITGRYQYRLPVGLEEPLLLTSKAGLPPSHPTLPSLLKKAGYATALLGKWHLGALPDFGPLKSGYDQFYGFRGGALDYYTHQGDDHTDDLWDGDTPVHQTGYLTDMLGQRANDVIAAYAKAAKPFFLSLHFSAPHWPWEAPGDQAVAEHLRTASLMHNDGGSMPTYIRMIEALDAAVGRVLKQLDAKGLSSNTIVVFTSDNGGERFAKTWPFQGRKGDLLEGGLRVPAMVRWPGKIAKKTVCDQTAITMDWVPTFLAAAGASADPAYPLDGVDLTPFLTGKAIPVSRKLYWRYRGNGQRALREGDMKVLKTGNNTFLYNVVNDPLERVNLKALQPEVYNRMTADWDLWNKAMLPLNPGGNAGAQNADGPWPQASPARAGGGS